ncbi:MAG: cobalamin B12-binding domain-containing protein [Candidatus Marinimicrobia bacterium]|nr:cobalamin B12-binding domain-containing protein [Candidatus Neomarinimicrobiota bacterium]
MEKKIRIVLAKPGLDGHDRGAKVLANSFRDAGMEVIYLGLRQTPEMIVNAAIQEDADVIAVSILSGAHMTIFPKIVKLKKDNEINDVLLIGGGVIPSKDIKELKENGVTEIFGPGTSTKKINQFINDWFVKNPRD